MMRKVMPRVGGMVWIDGSEVPIVKVDGRDVTVRLADGTEQTSAHYDLDTGWEFLGNTGWCHEGDPRVLEWLGKQVAKYEAETWAAPVENDRRQTIAHLRGIIERQRPRSS